MDRARIQDTFDRLYEKVEGYPLSHQERNRLATEDSSLIYGEVIPEGFLEVLAQTEPAAGETFYDLGSGTGRAVLLAAMAYPFARLVGIEFLQALHDAAEGVRARFEAEVRPTLTEAPPRQSITLRCGDFLEADLSDANVIFMQSNCFQPPLIKALVKKFEALPSGVRILALGQFLNAAHLVQVETGPCELGWGDSFFALYRRR
jgi:SAM-dependent methyltransferase